MQNLNPRNKIILSHIDCKLNKLNVLSSNYNYKTGVFMSAPSNAAAAKEYVPPPAFSGTSEVEMINKIPGSSVRFLKNSSRYNARDFSYVPMFNNRYLGNVGLDILAFFNITKLTFDVANNLFHRVIAENPGNHGQWFCWYFEVQPATDDYHRAYPYIPNPQFSLQAAISKICRIQEDNPTFQIVDAVYNRHGVGVYGIDTTSPRIYAFCYGSPDDFSAEFIDTQPQGDARGVNIARVDKTISYRDDQKGCFLNGEPAKKMDVKYDLMDSPELAKMRAEQRAKIAEATTATGVKLINNTEFRVDYYLNITGSKLRNNHVFMFRIDGRKLMFPNVSTISGAFRGEVTLERSKSFTLDQLPDGIVRFVEVDQDGTNTYFVDMTTLIDKVAYKLLMRYPRNWSMASAYRQIEATKFDDNSSSVAQTPSGIEVGASNEHGTMLVVRSCDANGNSRRRIFYGAAGEKDLKEKITQQLQVNTADTLETTSRDGTLAASWSKLVSKMLTTAIINSNPARVIRPEEIMFHRGVEYIIKQLDPDQESDNKAMVATTTAAATGSTAAASAASTESSIRHYKTLLPDIWNIVLEYARWHGKDFEIQLVSHIK